MKHFLPWMVVIGVALILLLVWLVVGTLFTDPYSRLSTVRSPYETKVNDKGEIELIEAHKPFFWTDPRTKLLALVRAGIRIVLYSHLPEPKLGDNEGDILTKLHSLRFDPSKPYVITGGHYSDLYVRNLGIFFDELLDTSSTNKDDLVNRQRLALQTVALDLAFLRANGKLVTTIVPLGGSSFTGINIYAEPSDSLYAVLFTLKTLQKEPGTRAAANQLLDQNKVQLKNELQRYLQTVLDPQTLVVKKDIHLSGARDGVQRQAAFYDTVIAWKTLQLARNMDLVDKRTWPKELEPILQNTWRKKIIDTYWKDDKGYFANDLSQNGDQFGGDSLIAYSTGFLNPQLQQDTKMLAQIVDYIQQNKLDQPFPLRYSQSNAQNTMTLPVKILAPGYMGEGIWSHWGIEYIQTLAALSRTSLPKKCEYLQSAKQALDAYSHNIEETGGYPELYGPDGKPFQTAALRAVLYSGWVVNYDTTKALVAKYLSTTRCRF